MRLDCVECYVTSSEKISRVKMRKKKIKLADLLLENPTPEKPYEEFLWGQDRGKDEEDLDSEIDLYNDFYDFVHVGDGHAVPKNKVTQLINLRDTGTYTDVLQVPSRYRYAWRVIELDANNPPSWIDADLVGKTDLPPTLLKKNFSMPLWSGQSLVSWTVDDIAVMQLLIENVHPSKQWVCVIRVDLGSHRQDFLGNPDELSFITQDFAWQQEVFQARDTTCDLAAVCSKSLMGPRENQQLMSMVVN